MKYCESAEQSAEYMRLAIPLMAKQAAALHPVSYAVWYEYVAGTNLPLKREIDEQVRGGARLTEETTHGLYRRYIAELDEESVQRISGGVQRVLAQVSQSAAQAGDQASRFGTELDRLSEGLTKPNAGPGLVAEIDKVLHGTREMQQAIGTLQARLDESRLETERLRQEVNRARQEALSDDLTGLANRKGFDRALEACLAGLGAGLAGPSLLMADIDHFKRVNDVYGHLFGDRVIRAIGQALRANVKGKDTAARYGGEEFVVLLPETPLAGARALADNLRATIADSRIKRINNDETVGNITISVGVAHYRAGESVVEFVGRADRALYRSKSEGRNRVTVANAD